MPHAATPGAPVARSRLALALAAVLLGLVVWPNVAGADADPASDFLLTQRAYFSYEPVSNALKAQLQDLLNRAAVAGFPLKVAIVATPADLGAVTAMFDQPTRYAPFLANEISFNSKQSLLVVMPDGLATANVARTRSISGLAYDRSTTAGLTRAAVVAAQRLAAENGHPVAAPSPSSAPADRERDGSGGGGGGAPTTVLFLGPLALLALAAGAGMVIRRRREDPGHDRT